jgi:group I intron endonuclease
MTILEIKKLFKNKCGIYLFTNKINDKKYIGKTINELLIRICEHFHPSNNQIVDKAIRKYGLENFDIEIIEEFNLNTMDNITLLALEVAYIDFYTSLTTQNGYNVYLFGNDPTGIKFSNEHKNNMSLVRIGKKNPNYGKKLSNERKLKISLANTGDKNHHFDHSIYKFQNKLTKEIFIGRRYDFRRKYNLTRDVNSIISGRRKSCKNWIYLNKI